MIRQAIYLRFIWVNGFFSRCHPRHDKVQSHLF
jgi:hypothetical protein